MVKPRMSLLNRAGSCSFHLLQNPILLITPITGHVRRLSLKKGMGNFATSSDIPELLWCLGVVGETGSIQSSRKSTMAGLCVFMYTQALILSRNLTSRYVIVLSCMCDSQLRLAAFRNFVWRVSPFN